MLPTASIEILTNNGLHRIRILLDQCAQKTVMLCKIAMELELKVTRSTQLCIYCFGIKGRYHKYDCVEINVMINSEKCLIEAVLVDSLSDRVNIPGLSETIQSLKTTGIILVD